MYCDSMRPFLKTVKAEIEEIWPGMTVAPICLFRTGGPAYLMNHPDPSKEFTRISDELATSTQQKAQLYGATQVMINGVMTAIVDYGSEKYAQPIEAMAEMFHELHHVYQRTHLKKVRYDNPAEMLTYPEDPRNDALKLYEQKILYQLCFAGDDRVFERLLNLFYSSRIVRKKIIGSYFDYEKAVENIEGPAFYCEMKYLERNGGPNDAEMSNAMHCNFWSVLNAPCYGRNQLRMRHLAAGMAMCVVLDGKVPGWKADYYKSGMDLFDFFADRLHPETVSLPDLPVENALGDYFTNQAITAHREAYSRFLSQSGMKVHLRFRNTPDFRGFDPMHAESIDRNIVLHYTLLNLAGNNGALYITNHEVLTETVDSIWFVKSLDFFVPESDIVISNGKIRITTDTIKLEWAGSVVKRENNRIEVECL